MLEKLWRIVYRLTLLLGLIALTYYFFLQPMKVSGQNPVDPFIVGQYIMSERISFLVREPKVGDAVIFNTPTVADGGSNGGVLSYFGVITKIINKNNQTTYQIISTKTQLNSWEVSRDKIIARIYYPVVR